MKHNVAIFLTILMVGLVSTQVNLLGTSNDYQNMFKCTTENTFVQGSQWSCEHYPPLMKWVGGLFTAREEHYKEFLVTLTFLVLPLVLYGVSKNPLTVWFYFSVTNYSYASITSMFIAQHALMILLFSMFLGKDRHRFFLFLGAIILHSTGFWLALITWGLIKFQEWFSESSFDLKKIFLGCSPFWGDKIPPILNQKMLSSAELGAGYLTPNILLSFLVKRTPLPYLYLAVKELGKRKELALLGLMVIFTIAGLGIHERGFYFVALPMVIGLTWSYETLSVFHKKLLLISSFLFFLWNIYQFFTILHC